MINSSSNIFRTFIQAAQLSSYMDIQKQKKPPLEPIQEESEQEDFSFQEGLTDKLQLEDENEEDSPLRVMRPGRRICSFSSGDITDISSDSHQKEMKSFSTANLNIFSDGETTQQPVLETERRTRCGNWRTRLSKIMVQKPTPLEPSKKRRQSNKNKLMEPFPQWLVNLMVNIEEATTHQLVVE